MKKLLIAFAASATLFLGAGAAFAHDCGSDKAAAAAEEVQAAPAEAEAGADAAAGCLPGGGCCGGSGSCPQAMAQESAGGEAKAGGCPCKERNKPQKTL